MKEIEIFNTLKKDFPKLIADKYPFPKPFKGDQEIRAIILGADPTNIVNGEPTTLNVVFGLDKDKSPYWNSMKRNIHLLSNISMNNVYVQNICRNYFTKETSLNKNWSIIARDYWSELLKEELDREFDENIPVLMTTEFILHSIKKKKGKVEASKIYNNCITFSRDENLLSREIIAFYRHQRYSLNNWDEYKTFLDRKLKRL